MTQLLALLEILLAPQVLGVGAFVWFVRKFRNELGLLLSKPLKLKTPLGELQTGRTRAEVGVSPAVAALPSPDEQEAAGPATGQQVTLADPVPPVAPAFDRDCKEAWKLARLWEYRYLNYYLVPNTQSVLDWLTQQGTISAQRFDASWQTAIPSAVERASILGALEQHYLIRITDGMIEVTDKGREYMELRGPALPAAVPTL